MSDGFDDRLDVAPEPDQFDWPQDLGLDPESTTDVWSADADLTDTTDVWSQQMSAEDSLATYSRPEPFLFDQLVDDQATSSENADQAFPAPVEDPLNESYWSTLEPTAIPEPCSGRSF